MIRKAVGFSDSLFAGRFNCMRAEEIIKRFRCEPEDEYDKALIFSLKKWIADEINEMCDNGICALIFSLEGLQGYIGYNTEKQLEEYGSGLDGWKNFKFASVNDDPAVEGSVEMWYDFKGFDNMQYKETVYKTKYYQCAVNAFLQLVMDGVIKERFGRNIEASFMGCNLEGFIRLTVDENGEMTY